MNLSPGARRAEQFAALLDRPERTDDPALAPYLALAGALQAIAPATSPAPEFRAALRQRLLAVATVQGVGEPETGTVARLREARTTWKMQRRLAVLAGGAAAVTAIAGVGIGASRSLPGDPFYGVKRATERVQLATSVGQEAKGKRHLEFARTRLGEVEALAGQSSALSPFVPGTAAAAGTLTEGAKASTIVSTLHDMDSETRAGANDLLAVARDTGSVEPLRALDTFAQAQFGDLRSVLPELPTGARAQAQRSLALLTVVAHSTVSQAGTGAGSGGSTPGTTGSSSHPTQTPAAGQSSTPAGPQQQSSSPATQPSGTPSLPSVPTSIPTEVPTIPSLPTTLPSVLPTSIPTLPSLSDLQSALPTLGN